MSNMNTQMTFREKNYIRKAVNETCENRADQDLLIREIFEQT